ncbi:MAG: ATP-binding protein [Candidatus Methanomethylophilaceae archaeon]|jgi:PAS domain S-box-containing protein
MASSDDGFLDGLSLEEARNILRASMSILSHDAFPVVARNVFQGLKEQTGARAGYVALLSDDGMENEIVYLDPGDYECHVDESLPMPIRGFRGLVYGSGRAQYCNDFLSTEHWHLMPPGHVGLFNVMFAPLILEGEVRGLLGLSNKDGGFTDRDALLGELYGRMAALALHNSLRTTELKASEERYRHLAEGAFDAIAALGKGGTVLFANPSFRSMTRLSDEELVGRDIHELLPGAEIPAEEGVHKLRPTFADGRSLSLEASMSRTILGGEDVRVLIVRDVTEKEALERKMRLVDRKMELMGKITRHDVLNHIMVVQGYLELSQGSGQPLTEKGFARINEALEKTKSLYMLQREFEALGTASAQWVDLRTAYGNARSELALDTAGVDFRMDVDALLWVDSLFEKVLYNLLYNALVHGRPSVVGIEAQEGEEEVLLDVYDDGSGIPEDEKQSIFTLGFGKNSGQGLFLVREILDTYGMRVEEVGEPGCGARFRIHVPHGSWRGI